MQDQEEKLSEINISLAKEHNEKLKNIILESNEKDIERIAAGQN